MPSSSDITELLISWCDGNETALETLAPLVESELRRLAHSFMRKEHPGHILETTALVNEAFIGLVHQNRIRWQNRAHFFGIAGQIMRRILSNYARDQRRIKRGGGALQVSLSEVAMISPVKLEEVLAIDEALTRLALIDEQMSRMIEMRFYGGLSVKETAEVLNISTAKVNRDCKFARAWLAREMNIGRTDSDE
ncbi:MAG TPA: sigma-70 family RNA polymerase sigma factor [Pyrinomonadaceae bacterium]|jgi:RNA polymerase sigma factor (TIGR02999 family)